MKNFPQSKKDDFVFQLRFPALANRVFYKEAVKTTFIQFSFYVVHRPQSPVFSKYVRKFSPVFYFMSNESWKLDIFFIISNVFFTLEIFIYRRIIIYSSHINCFMFLPSCHSWNFFGKLKISGNSNFHNLGLLSLFSEKKKERKSANKTVPVHTHMFFTAPRLFFQTRVNC